MLNDNWPDEDLFLGDLEDDPDDWDFGLGDEGVDSFYGVEDDGPDAWDDPLVGLMVEDRPHHGPRQIRTMRGVKNGLQVYICSQRHASRRRVTLTSGPQFRQDLWYVTYSDNGRRGELYLADKSIIPYSSGDTYDRHSWNDWNWLERIK